MALDYRDKYHRKAFGGPWTLTNVASTPLNQWFGVTPIAALTTPVTSTLVTSSTLVLVSPMLQTAAGTGGPIVLTVASITPGVGFTIAVQNSVSLVGSVLAAWLLLQPQRNW
jgi:hypothetical protein